MSLKLLKELLLYKQVEQQYCAEEKEIILKSLKQKIKKKKPVTFLDV